MNCACVGTALLFALNLLSSLPTTLKIKLPLVGKLVTEMLDAVVGHMPDDGLFHNVLDVMTKLISLK